MRRPKPAADEANGGRVDSHRPGSNGRRSAVRMGLVRREDDEEGVRGSNRQGLLINVVTSTRGPMNARLVFVLPLTLVLGSAATVSALILQVVIDMLTLFAIVGLSFTFRADIRAVPTPPADVAACDIVISVLDGGGVVLDTREARVPSGQAFTLQYRSRAARGGTEPIRATVKSRTASRPPLPPGPCPVLASMQVIDEISGRTEAMLMPAAQQLMRETVRAP